MPGVSLQSPAPAPRFSVPPPPVPAPATAAPAAGPAPQASASPPPPAPPRERAAGARSAHAHDMRAGLMAARLGAAAERELGPVSPTQKFDLSSPEGRVDLLRHSSQVNAVSRRAGNDGLICGGAAAAAGLVMSARTPEQAHANAKAVEDTARHLGVTPSADQQKAVTALRDGKMAPRDHAHLQQLLYALGQRAGIPEGGSGDGLGPKQVFALAGQLKAAGAFSGADVRFHQNATPVGSSSVNHWTVSVDNQFYNSMHPAEQRRDQALVLGGTPQEVAERHGSWSAEVHVGEERVTGDFRSGSNAGIHYRLRADVADLRARDGRQSTETRPSRTSWLYNWQNTVERDGAGGIKEHPVQ